MPGPRPAALRRPADPQQPPDPPQQRLGQSGRVGGQHQVGGVDQAGDRMRVVEQGAAGRRRRALAHDRLQPAARVDVDRDQAH
jgi:hypothetical protein